ncbi:MAG TPA: ATP-binding protein [Myxococcota bacterium]|nr:ATP-binding protein [Myxococcota bacterium]HRY93944.1 ATP-binding protein [Myxococcota bacterium]HSA21271.1 ATP-binding protein [Myxococcota bacterium]
MSLSRRALRSLLPVPVALLLGSLMALGLVVSAVQADSLSRLAVGLLAGLLFVALGVCTWAAVLVFREARALAVAFHQLAAEQSPAIHPSAHRLLQELAEAAAELQAALDQRDAERQEAERLVTRALRREALLRMASGVVREVQQPLAGVIGFAELAMRQPGVSGQLKTYLTMILQESRAGRDALERVAQLAGLHETPQEVEALELNPVVSEALLLLREPLQAAAIQLVERLQPGLPRVRANAALLRGAIQALVDNAQEAMQPGPGRLEIASQRGPLGATLTVRDSGPGLHLAVQQDMLFTPYHSTRGRRSAGFGLALAEAGLAAMGGRLEVASEPGQGCVFFVHLRAADAAATSDAP